MDTATLSARSPARMRGYDIGPLLSAGGAHLVYRATEQASGRAVVVKIARDPYPGARELAVQQRAYELARTLASEAVVAHLALEPCGHGLALVTEDFGAESIDRTLRERGPQAQRAALTLVLHLARALAQLHRRGFIHQDIAPSNLLWNAERQMLKLSNLSRCTSLREMVQGEQDAILPATPTYIAPEQTGRMNRPVDQRADLYAAGVVLYEIVAGVPPFVSADPKSLIHAHLARRPPDLNALGLDLHPALPLICEKLLSKDPEGRYASAEGLAVDLQRCLDDLDNATAKPFTLGSHDRSDRFFLSDRLYGRESEIRALTAAVDACALGKRQSLLVAGYSGVGKSALIAEAQAPLAGHRGWFCAGKFDQFRRDMPYLAWRDALASLTRQALALPQTQLGVVRAELETVLAGNGALIAELVPEAVALFGELKPLPPAGPAESQARFDHAFRAFVRVLARADHPVVLFVDDLQWADLASLELFESLVSDLSAAHLLVLGAYRDNEVGPGHRLTASLARLEALAVRPKVLPLGPLSLQDLLAMVAEGLAFDPDVAAPLAALVHRKTAGNPFFVRQFLGSLVSEGLLAFDSSPGQWRWDLSAIERQGYTDNVVEFMGGRIRELPSKTVRILQLGSCLGAVFDLHEVSRIASQPSSHVAGHLEVALASGMLLPIGSDYRLAVTESSLAEREGRAPSINPRYTFLHDRVQQSVHESIEPADRASIHLRIARGLLAQIDPLTLPRQAVEVMDHLVEALDQLEDDDERRQFARLCLVAGQRAKAAMATEPAVRYLEMGRGLLPANAWTEEPELNLQLHMDGADACYVTERYSEAQALARTVLAHTEDLSHRVAAYSVLIGIGVAQRRYVETTMLGLTVLEKELGVKLPRRAGLLRVLLGILRTRAALHGRSADALLALPVMQDPRAEAAIAVLMKSSTNAYWGSPNLVPLIAGEMVRLSLRKGNVGLSAYGYALFGMILANAVEAVDSGYALGKLAMDLLEKTGDRHLVGKTGLLWHGFIRHAKDPLRLCAVETLACYDHAMDAGDVENAVYCGTVAYFADLLAGRSLGWIEQRYRDYVPALLASSQAQTTLTLRGWMQAAINLADPQRTESKTVGELVDWPSRLKELLTDPGSSMAIASVAASAGWLAFLLDDWPEAEHQLSLLYERGDAALGQAFWKPCMAIYGIVLSRALAGGTGGMRARLRLARVTRWVGIWARRNPHDYAAYLSALAAERAARGGHRGSELAAWHDAATRSHDGGNLFLEAWANEQAAHCHGRAGHREQAHQLLEHSRLLWQRYGARARLRILVGAGAPSPAEVATPAGGKLDFNTVLGAVRAISGSIEPDQLVARVLEVLLVQSGAQRATLLAVQQDRLRPMGMAKMDDQGRLVQVSAFTDPAAAPQLPSSLLDYVSRTRRLLAVDNAVTHEWLARDPYVARFAQLALIGAPLMQQGQMVGMVVLENDVCAGVFSEADANLVEAIAGQAAVSLENARLFAAQRRQAEAFGRFVPRPFLENLGRKDIEDIRLGEGVQRQVTVMFTDLRGFTALSEQLSAHDTFELVNAVLARLGPVLVAEGGFIDEFTGDGVKALFIDRADGAVRAGIAMQHRLRQYSTERAARGLPPLAMGVGVHSGAVLLGTIGAEGRMATTVLGDTVNTTARLEGLSKAYGTPFLISDQTRAELRDPLAYGLRTVGRVRFKGRRQAILVHEVIDAREPATRARLGPVAPQFNEAVAAYLERQFADAARGFAACLALVPDDALARDYLDWSKRWLVDGVDTDWDGALMRAEK